MVQWRGPDTTHWQIHLNKTTRLALNIRLCKHTIKPNAEQILVGCYNLKHSYYVQVVNTHPMINETEKELITRFVIKAKQDRYLGFLAKATTRDKFTKELYHFKDFNLDLFREIPGTESETDMIAAQVRRSKASLCYVISVSSEFDGRYFPVHEALDHVIGTEGTILIFGRADVVYYEGEAPGSRYISI